MIIFVFVVLVGGVSLALVRSEYRGGIFGDAFAQRSLSIAPVVSDRDMGVGGRRRRRTRCQGVGEDGIVILSFLRQQLLFLAELPFFFFGLSAQWHGASTAGKFVSQFSAGPRFVQRIVGAGI